MRIGIFLATALVLAGCGPTAQERETDKLLEEMGLNDSKKEYGAPMPDHALRCTFKSRSYCISGECRTMETDGKAAMYVEIDAKAKTYKRCGPTPGDCGTHDITAIGMSGDYTNVTVGPGGTLFKYGPGGRFTDIATQAPQTFVSGGTCAPIAEEGV